MRKSNQVLALSRLFIALFLITACGSNATQPQNTPTVESPTAPTFTPLPSTVPLPTETAWNTQPPYSTETPLLASQLQGVWHRYSTANGFCTDWPLFIGHNFIGTGTATICSFENGNWSSIVVPQGTRVTAANIFPPGGGWGVATDVGMCSYAYQEWRCQTQADGFPYEGIRALVPFIGAEPVYMLEDAVVFNKITYKLPNIVGAADATPTWIAVSGEFIGEGFLPPEIWVGTNGYGVVVIQPGIGNIVRYTTNDGLPSNVIRDINTEHCPKYCDFRDVWVATDQGIAHWDGANWATYTTANGLPSNDVQGVSSGQRNAVWVATAAGAAYFDGNAWQIYTHDNDLPEGDINGVLWQRNEILFSTHGSGLLVFTIQSP
jgi:hypothetical protein